jgi:hypothetical protein
MQRVPIGGIGPYNQRLGHFWQQQNCQDLKKKSEFFQNN